MKKEEREWLLSWVGMIELEKKKLKCMKKIMEERKNVNSRCI